MKKSFLFLVLSIGLANISSADYLDDWSDKDLCGWMENPSPPSYMVDEVKARGISCSWGVVINNLPDSSDVNEPIAAPDAVVPEDVSEEFTLETFLSDFALKTEDLSPMIVELMKTSEVTPPACTKDFCFSTQPDYGGNGATWGNGDAILNIGDLINGLYRHHPDFNQGSNLRPMGKNYRENIPKRNTFHDWNDENVEGNGAYCSKKYGCYGLKKLPSVEAGGDWRLREYLNQGLFPDGTLNNQAAWNGDNVTPYLNFYGWYEGKLPSGELLTPNRWLEENDLTAEDVVKMLEDYPTTYRFDYRKINNAGELREKPYQCGDVGNAYGVDPSKKACNDSVKWGKGFEGPRLGDCSDTGSSEEACIVTTIDLAPKYAEILNADQLMESLLYLDPDAFGENLTYDLEGYKNMAIQYKKICDSDGHVFGKCTFEITNPNKIVVTQIPIAVPPLPVPPIVQPPLEPIPPIPIRPGWKIAEGSNFWTIDEDDPYWQTEEGIKKHEAAKDRESWIEQEASRYAQDNPGVDAPIPSYYATDPCGEGKQPENASC